MTDGKFSAATDLSQRFIVLSVDTLLSGGDLVWIFLLVTITGIFKLDVAILSGGPSLCSVA